MTQEQEPDRAAYRKKVDHVLESLAAVGPDALAERAQAIRDKLTTQLAANIAKARAAERDKCEQELAAALGVEPRETGWSTLISMVLGIRPIADLVVGSAVPGVDEARRRDLLVSFGVAEEWSRVAINAEMSSSGLRQALGLDDPARPGGGVQSGEPE